MRFEVNFNNIEEFDIFSESNSLKFNAQSWNLLEIYQENASKPVRWIGSNMKRLLGTSLPEGEDTELIIEVCLRSDKFGKNICSRIQTLDKISSSGLSIKIDGKAYRANFAAIRTNTAQRYLPSRQEPSDNMVLQSSQPSASQIDATKQWFNETGLREIYDPSELKSLKALDKELEQCK